VTGRAPAEERARGRPELSTKSVHSFVDGLTGLRKLSARNAASERIAQILCAIPADCRLEATTAGNLKESSVRMK
jgi:hypothetical protein